MQEAIQSILHDNPDYGIKKIKTILQMKYPKVTTKLVREILDQINDQKDTANNQSLAESSLSPSIDLTLKFHQILVGLLNSSFQRKLQAITHVLGGRFGDYDVANESILRLARVHPLYGMGNSANTPLHSCKLATTLLRMLTSTYDINSLKQSANCLARSAGAFVGMEYASPNT